MIVFLNGQFVPETQATVSVFDRGFLYGDGLFETMRVSKGRLFRWTQHLNRLLRGAVFLGIRLPFSSEALLSFATELIRQNALPNALLRLTVSRGVGPRGYSPKGADQPTVVMTLHAAPDWQSAEPPRWKLITASVRVTTGDPLAQFKTCNKLPHVLARAEADARGADDALLLNTDRYVVEASSANLFWVEGDTLCTPPLEAGALPGVTRSVVLELCQTLRVFVREVTPRPEAILRADGVFLSLSSWGILAASALDGHVLPEVNLIQKLRHSYARVLESETSTAIAT